MFLLARFFLQKLKFVLFLMYRLLIYSHTNIESDMNIKMKLKKFTSEEITAEHNSKILEEIVLVFMACFKNWNKERFIQEFIINKESANTSMYVLLVDSHAVGYCISQIFSYPFDNQYYSFMSSDAAVLPQYRKKFSHIGLCAKTAIEYKLRHPLTKIYFVNILLSYRFYKNLLKICPLYPSPFTQAPPALDNFRLVIAKKWGFTIHENKCAATSGEISEEKAIIEDISEKEIFEYFDNKTEHQTYGMLIIIDLTWTTLLKVYFKIIAHIFYSKYSKFKILKLL
jgi:hypothetical protein